MKEKHQLILKEAKTSCESLETIKPKHIQLERMSTKNHGRKPVGNDHNKGGVFTTGLTVGQIICTLLLLRIFGEIAF